MARETILVCSECGSLQIQVTAWIYANRYPGFAGGDGPTDQVYCPRCDDETGMVAIYRVGDSNLWKHEHFDGHASLREQIRKQKRAEAYGNL